MEKKSKFKIYSMGESLLFAVFFLILGVVLVTNPLTIIKTVLYVIGSFAIVVGVFKLIIYSKVSNYTDNKDKENKKDLFNGIIFLLFGTGIVIAATVFYENLVSLLVIVLSVYLLYIGIFRLANAFKVNKQKRLPYYINAGVVILIGLILLFFPSLPFVVIGIFLIIYSITEIFGFVTERDNYNRKKEVKEAEVVEIVETKKLEQKELEVKEK